MTGFGDHKKSQKKIKKNLKDNYFKEQIIQNALKFHTEGNISEAVKYYKSFIIFFRFFLFPKPVIKIPL